MSPRGLMAQRLTWLFAVLVLVAGSGSVRRWCFEPAAATVSRARVDEGRAIEDEQILAHRHALEGAARRAAVRVRGAFPPSGDAMETLLHELVVGAARSGATIVSVEPQHQLATEAPDDPLVAQPIEVRFRATFGSTVAFVQRFAHEPLAVGVCCVQLRASSPGDKERGLDGSVQVSLYAPRTGERSHVLNR